jgi:VIT1/CCC1 family predicted Fe2+/Mn2+ transporter
MPRSNRRVTRCRARWDAIQALVPSFAGCYYRSVYDAPEQIERHLVHRSGWLRAAVLGANDGIVSTASLVIGVAAASASRNQVLVAGLAGLVAGAASMGLGEFVSVSSQRDVERADLAREARELAEEPEAELQELAQLYVGHGLSEDLARRVAEELSAKDALLAHAREELHIVEATRARPILAAFSSSAAFALGAVVPLAFVGLSPATWRIPVTSIGTLLALVGLGSLGASLGGAGVLRPTVRVVVGGALALLLTGLIGRVVGTAL